MISKKHNELIHGNIYTHTKAEMSENNSAITKHWNEVLRLNQDEVRIKADHEKLSRAYPYQLADQALQQIIKEQLSLERDVF